MLVPERPDSGGAQFFVCVTDQPSLTGKYTVFGRVVDGLVVVDAIEQAPVNGETPVARVELESVRVVK